MKLGMSTYPDAKGEHGFVLVVTSSLHASLKASHSAKKKYLTSGKDVNPGGTHFS